LFDFSKDTLKRWTVNYSRNHTNYSLTFGWDQQFYNQKIADTAVIFRAYQEVQGLSLTIEFLIQSSLKKGLVSFRVVNREEKRIYQIDLLPYPNMEYKKITTPIFQNE
jgi:hypothetical protein